jgi:hypothetical protein
MLQWCRVRAGRVAAALLVSMTTLGASHAWPHDDDCHDAACVVVAHDASAHVIGAKVPPESQPQHCLVCHWARAFRPPTEARITHVPAIGGGITLHAESDPVAAPEAAAQPPLRAPPASPTLS